MGGEILDYEAKRILNKGREEGRKEGIRQCKEEGIKEGMRLKEKEIVNKMLIQKMDISVIMNITDMPKKTLEDMRNELKKAGRL